MNQIGFSSISLHQCDFLLVMSFGVSARGRYQFRIQSHRVPTLLSVYTEVLTPPSQIGNQYHPQIGTLHQILDYHFLVNRATPPTHLPHILGNFFYTSLLHSSAQNITIMHNHTFNIQGSFCPTDLVLQEVK